GGTRAHCCAKNLGRPQEAEGEILPLVFPFPTFPGKSGETSRYSTLRSSMERACIDLVGMTYR
ncbi:hypothetical protein PspLS_04405, partial [Pyricularia sp. CBS 133598]